ncbi:Solute carrier family 35 member F6 isoform B [Chlorella sorokiniana]|uniref:Solute carrier family 35 member F6 isoform B n=1 Tax=Chlorella sorokiniana TaxID=3076 RepID=A0A2P6TZA0_CHLSO|nr:Solute carrier family 35 member F6 isoform B [Chlorella sorokiniana]|eukprot:PRW59396.1 Solute carrier family 35 member F6 isoform B [Chlorella sorokiniana]
MAVLPVTGLLFFGTLTSLFAKIVYELDGPGRDGAVKNFQKPWAMTTVMFVAMSFCLPLAFWTERRERRRATKAAAAAANGDAAEPLLGDGAAPVGPKHSELAQALMLFIPTAFDLIATVLMNVGLLSVTASVYQMMRGAEMLFAALFAVIFLRRSLNRWHYGGIGCCVLGITLVGVSSMLSGEGSASHEVSPRDMLIGMGLIIASQCVQAAQITFEDFFMADLAIPPLKIVGYEGVLGAVTMLLLVLPVVQRLPGADGQGLHEDSVDTWHMITHSKVIATVLVVDATALLMYNVSGMCVTGHLGAVFRTVLETMRTLFVWLVDLVLFYTPLGLGKLGESWSVYSWIQAAGFVVLVAGTVIYGKGDEQAVAEEIAEGHYDADVEEPVATGAPHLPTVGSSGAVGIPAAAAGPSGTASGSIPIATSIGGSLKSTQNIGAFSGSLSRSLAAAQQGQPQPLSEWTAANATSYAALGALPNGTSPSNTTALRLGACGFSVDRTYSSWPGISTGALGPGNPFANELDMTGCGACFEVQCGQGNGTSAQSPCIAGAGGNRSSVIITVQDGCPGCPADQLALHPLAFARLANLSRNAIPVRYRQVACQPPENIQVVVEAYNLGGEGWLRLHLEQVGGTGGIQSLWIRSTPSEGSPAATDASLAGLQSQWRQLNNLNSTAAWELNGVPKPPLDLLIYPSLGRPLLATVHGGGDLLSTFGDQGLMFALDQGGAASYRGTSQLLDSLASTYDEDRLALHQQAASLPRQYHDPYAFTAAAPVGHPVLHATAAPFAGYGSQLQHGYGSASLPPRPPMATRPSSSIAFGGQGDAFGGGLPPLPRPATSGAVYRSTSEWGQLNTSQKEAAQRDLMSTLHEDEMFTSTTQATEGGPAAIPLSAGLPVSRMSGAAHSPALSLDSLRSAVHRGGSARPPTQAMPVPMPASPGAVPQQGEEPLSAWWGDEAQPPYHQEQSLWGPAEGEEAPQPAVQHSLLSQGLHQAGLASAGAYDAGGMGEGALPHASSGGFAPYDMKTSPQKLETASASPPPGSSQSSLPAGQFEGER